MRARLRSWWQHINQHRLWSAIIIVAIVLVIALIVVAVLGYWLNLSWVGVSGGNSKVTTTTTSTGQPPAKTIWDWLQLLIIPLALAVIALVFQLANIRTERQIANERYKQDREIALHKQRQDLLEEYLDCMSGLLLNKELRTSEPDSEVRNVDRARTLTVLPQLDATRKGNLIQYLSESKLLEIIVLNDANLNNAHLSGDHLSGAKVSEEQLAKAKSLEGATMPDGTERPWS